MNEDILVVVPAEMRPDLESWLAMRGQQLDAVGLLEEESNDRLLYLEAFDISWRTT